MKTSLTPEHHISYLSLAQPTPRPHPAPIVLVRLPRRGGLRGLLPEVLGGAPAAAGLLRHAMRAPLAREVLLHELLEFHPARLYLLECVLVTELGLAAWAQPRRLARPSAGLGAGGVGTHVRGAIPLGVLQVLGGLCHLNRA